MTKRATASDLKAPIYASEYNKIVRDLTDNFITTLAVLSIDIPFEQSATIPAQILRRKKWISNKYRSSLTDLTDDYIKNQMQKMFEDWFNLEGKAAFTSFLLFEGSGFRPTLEGGALVDHIEKEFVDQVLTDVKQYAKNNLAK